MNPIELQLVRKLPTDTQHAGKSTLLDILALRKTTGVLKGQVG